MDDDAVVTLLRRTLEVCAEDVDDRFGDRQHDDLDDRRRARRRRIAEPTTTPWRAAPHRTDPRPRHRRRSPRWSRTAVAVATLTIVGAGVGVGGMLAVDRAGRRAGPQPATTAPPPASTAPATLPLDRAADVAWVLPVALPPGWRLTEILAVDHSAGGSRTPADPRRHLVAVDPDTGDITGMLSAGVQPAWPGTRPITANATVGGIDAELSVQPEREVRDGQLPLVMVRWHDDGLELWVSGFGISADAMLAAAEAATMEGGGLTLDATIPELVGFSTAISHDGVVAVGVDGLALDGSRGPTVSLTARSLNSDSPILITAEPASGDLDHHIDALAMPESYRRTVDGVVYSVRLPADESIGTFTFLTWVADGYLHTWSGPFEPGVALQFAPLRPAVASEAAAAATELAERTMALPTRATAQFANGLEVTVHGATGVEGPVALCVLPAPPRCLQPTTDSGAGGRGETQIGGVFTVGGQRLIVGWQADEPVDVRGADGTPVAVVAGEEGWFLLAEIAAGEAVPRLVAGAGSEARTIFSPDDHVRP